MNLRDLKLRARALFRRGQVERDLQEELDFHIERESRKLIDEGMDPARARQLARVRFGSAPVTADECRDERGTALVDSTIGDVQYALRTFRRAPLAAATIVVTISIGLGIVAVLFTFLNTFLFRVDDVPDVAEIYAVQRPGQADGDGARLTRAQFDAMRRETHAFSDAYAAVPDVEVRVAGRTVSATLVTASFFQVVERNPVMGRSLTEADDARAGGNAVVVLSERGWTRRFDRDPNVIGRTILVGDKPFEIIGVMPEGFRGLAVRAPEFWAPLSMIRAFQPDRRGSDNDVNVEIIGRLAPGVSVESARAQLAAWDSNQQAPGSGRRAPGIELRERRGTIPQPMEALAVFVPLFVVFGLILLIGCANVANLLLARGVARQREIGIRLSLGASRSRIIRQLMTESLLLALVAAVGGYFVSRVFLESTVNGINSSAPLDLGESNLFIPAADWRVAVFLVFSAMAATGFFALLPALQATRVEPVRTLRGELIRDARPGRARNALIGIQVFASAMLLICAAIFLRSTIASSNFDPGLRTADTIMIEMVNESKRAALVQGIASDPLVASYGAVSPGLIVTVDTAVAVVGTTRTSVGYKFASPEYFQVLDIPIVRGRPFTAPERDGQHPVAIVSESTARLLWPNATGVGETFRLEPDADSTLRPEGEPPMPARTVTVVGVSRDIAGFRFNDVKDAGVMLPASLKTPGTIVVARVNENPDVARQALLERLAKIDPNLGSIKTFRSLARLTQFILNVAFSISVVLGGLALLLTASGLFSVLSYLVEQRTREIGVRMALGASSIQVVRLVLSQTARPVMYGLLLGIALAATLATVLIATPVGAFIAQVVQVTDPVSYALSVIVIVSACLVAGWIPSRRAARLDPIRTLRQD
jgi:predicted permease